MHTHTQKLTFVLDRERKGRGGGGGGWERRERGGGGAHMFSIVQAVSKIVFVAEQGLLWPDCPTPPHPAPLPLSASQAKTPGRRGQRKAL